jgi:pantoate--beta-alanine ligase
VPTLREPDGLAMSSRNVYLTPDERAIAPDLYRALLAGAAAAGKPGAAAKDVVVAATAALLLPIGGLDPAAVHEAPARPRFKLDYLAVVDEDTFVPEGDLGPRSRIVVAVYLGSTRLIDTISVASAHPAKDATA